MVTVFRHLLNLSQGQSVGQGQEKVKSQIFIKSSLNQGSTVRVIEIFWVRGPPRSADPYNEQEKSNPNNLAISSLVFEY